ncbi:hypothetical protein V8E36_009230 [Tilletia maclaganii]
MSQRVEKGPKFRPNIPIRRPVASGSSSGSAPASSSKAASSSASGSTPTPAAAASQTQHGQGTEDGAEAAQDESGASTTAAGASSTSTSTQPTRGSAIRPPSQIVAAGLRLTSRATAISPGQPLQSSSSRATSGAITPRSSGSAPLRPPPARITVGRQLPTPPSSQGSASRPRARPVGALDRQNSDAATGAGDSSSRSQDIDVEEGADDDAEGAQQQHARQTGDAEEDDGMEPGEDESSHEPKRKAPRAKKLTIDEEEAAYEEQEAEIADERRPDDDVSMAELSHYEVRSGRASRRTFDMMRKHEAHKRELKAERQELIDKLVRKRKAGKDWNDKFGSDEEEAAADEKRRRLRKQQKQRARRAGDGEGSEEEEEEDEGGSGDEDDGEETEENVARILANEAGDGDSDDGLSMSSDEGSDNDDAHTSMAGRKKKLKDALAPAAASAGKGKKNKRGQSKNAPLAPAADSGSSSGSDSEDGMFGESQAAVQIRLGPDGRPVLSESSLTVDPTKMADVFDAGVEGVTSVIETERFINSSTRGKRSVNARWAKEETDKFYMAISQWGTDFEMIARLFPTRSRHQIKLKFSREEKQDPDRVNLAFKTRIPVDLEAYGLAVGRNLSGPAPKISVKKPDDYLKMEEQERLLRESGDVIGSRAEMQGGSSTGRAGSESRRTERGSSADRRRSVSVGQTAGEGQSEGEDGAAVSGGEENAGPSSSTMRRSVTPGGSRRRSGSNAGSQGGTAANHPARATQRRGYDRERDRERAKALAEEQRKERERLHRAGSRRGGGVAYESQEVVLGDADD